jgi:Sel1 repeat
MEGRSIDEMIRMGTSAIPLVRAAAEGGSAAAQHTLGMIYAKEHDGAEAVKWLSAAAEQGFVESQAWLGKFYYFGIDGFPKNRDLALQWLRTASEQGHKRAQAIFAAALSSHGMYRESLKWALATAEVEASSQVTLGFLYFKGLCVERNLQTALRWFTRAATECVTFHFFVGQVHEALGNSHAALRSYLIAAPTHTESRKKITEACQNTHDLRALFILGQAGPVATENARRVYGESTDRARRAALCWMALKLIPQHDVVRLIGQMVYAQRADPGDWGVSG